MNSKTKIFLLAAVLSASLATIIASGQLTFAANNTEDEEDENEIDEITAQSDEVTQLKEAKLIIEHNDKDKDTGFQGFLDSEGWNYIRVKDPEGNQVLEFEASGNLEELGLTELFFETVEPENNDVTIDELLETMPEGEYTFEGVSVKDGQNNGTTIGNTTLTHTIPKGPELLTPEEDEEVPADADLLMSWEPVEQTIDGDDVNIIAYQLIVEKDEEPDSSMIGKMGLSMYLPSDVTELSIPHEALEPGTDYEWEVLAIEEGGNQSIMSSSFSTSD